MESSEWGGRKRDSTSSPFYPGNRFVSWWIRNPAFQGEVAASATIPPISDARALGWRLLEQVSMSLRVLWGSTLHKYEFFEVRGSPTILELSDGKATYVVLHANHPRELSDVCAVFHRESAGDYAVAAGDESVESSECTARNSG